MSAAVRRGACPTLAAPMATGDGLLARMNPVSGGVSPATLASIAQAAARFGNGLLEVTARGSLQIRGLKPTTAPQFAEAVDRLDISVRSGVPVETGPLAGLDPQEIADPTRLAGSIHGRIAGAGLSARLGPKVSVVVDGGGRLSLGGVLADVRLKAVRVDDGVLWRVAIGGTAENTRPLGVVGAEAACEVVVGLLEAVAAKGRTARARDLKAGEVASVFDMSRSTLPPSVPSDISPTSGEIGDRDASALPSPLWGGSDSLYCGTTIAAGQFRPTAIQAGRRGGGDDVLRPSSTQYASPPPPDPSGHPPHKGEGRAPAITTLALSDGRIALGIGLPFGQATAEQMAGFADTAAQHGTDEIRFAPGRALLALCRTATGANALKGAAAALGFVTDPADPRLAVVACAGAPACASGHLSARVIAAEIAAEAAAVLGDGELLHVSGCAKQCARPARAAFTLIGTATGAEIHLGDGTEGEPVARVANEDATAAFRRAAKTLSATKEDRRRRGPATARAGIRHMTTGKQMSAYDYIKDGTAIYERSFAIIRAEADLSRFSEAEADVAIRMIHACGQVEAAAQFAFSPGFVAAARGALQAGAPIFCDAEMVAHGVTRARLPAKNEVICTLRDPRTAALAQKIGNTRSAAALELWGEKLGGALVAIGNAPTALFHLLDVLRAGAPKPAAIIGMPVGFVGAAESKEALADESLGVPFAIVRGRMGGSAMTAAAVNALARPGL